MPRWWMVGKIEGAGEYLLQGYCRESVTERKEKEGKGKGEGEMLHL